jgi:hypothetical protein
MTFNGLHDIPENRHLHDHCRENLKSYIQWRSPCAYLARANRLTCSLRALTNGADRQAPTACLMHTLRHLRICQGHSCVSRKVCVSTIAIALGSSVTDGEANSSGIVLLIIYTIHMSSCCVEACRLSARHCVIPEDQSLYLSFLIALQITCSSN